LLSNRNLNIQSIIIIRWNNNIELIFPFPQLHAIRSTSLYLLWSHFFPVCWQYCSIGLHLQQKSNKWCVNADEYVLFFFNYFCKITVIIYVVDLHEGLSNFKERKKKLNLQMTFSLLFLYPHQHLDIFLWRICSRLRRHQVFHLSPVTKKMFSWERNALKNKEFNKGGKTNLFLDLSFKLVPIYSCWFWGRVSGSCSNYKIHNSM